MKERNNDINITPSEVLEITAVLGERSEDYLNGVKHGRVLREVALKAVEDRVFYLGYTLEETKVELEKIMKIIEGQGVDNNSDNKKKIITITYIVIVICIMAMFSMNFLK